MGKETRQQKINFKRQLHATILACFSHRYHEVRIQLAANKTKGEIPKQCRYPKRQKVFFQRPMKKEVSESWIKLLGKKNRSGPLKDNGRELWLSALKLRLF